MLNSPLPFKDSWSFTENIHIIKGGKHEGKKNQKKKQHNLDFQSLLGRGQKHVISADLKKKCPEHHWL